MTQCFPMSTNTAARSPIQVSRPIVTSRPFAGLFADRNIEPVNAVLGRAIGDRDMRGDQNIVFNRHIADTAERPNVCFLANADGGM